MAPTLDANTDSTPKANAWYVRWGANIQENAKAITKYLPTSTTKATQIYTAYKLFGFAGGSAIATTLALDKALIENGHSSKYYLSLSTFWGCVGYKAILAVNASNIDFKYKALCNLLFTSVSAGMVVAGEDAFKDVGDTTKSLKSVLFIAKMLDKTGTIRGLEDAYEKGSIEAAKYSMNNIKAILANPFIQNALAHQSLAVVKDLLMHKLITTDSMGLSAAFDFMQPNGGGISKFTKLMTFQLAKKMTDLGYRKLQQNLSSNVKKEIALATAQKVFDERKSDVIAETDGVGEIAFQINRVQEESMQTLSTLAEKITLSMVSTGSENPISAYPTLFLLNALTENIFSYNHIESARDYLNSMLYSKQENPLEEFQDFEERQMGGMTIRVHQDVQKAAYENLQEIAIMGGLPFMLERVKMFINASPADNGHDPNDFIRIMINSLKDMISNLAYAMQFGIVKVSSASELHNITHSIQEISKAVGITAPAQIEKVDILESLRAKMDTLSKPKQSGPLRLESEGAYLEISDYNLFVREDSRQLVHIEKLKFTPGIYAIKGKIGTGKTTLMKDIAGCLSGIFESNGTISYPTGSDGEIIPKIFCRIQSFSFPKVSFFEKLTFGIPMEYVNAHKVELIEQARQLFHEMGQGDFIDKIDFDSRKKIEFGSTGQEKMTIIVSAILRKQALGDGPVLLALDETLANLDDQTRDLVCQKIKEVFKDSIVLSVDHQAGHNPFYERCLDLSRPQEGIIDLHPENEIVEDIAAEEDQALDHNASPNAVGKITFAGTEMASFMPGNRIATKEIYALAKALSFRVNEEGGIEVYPMDQAGSSMHIGISSDITLMADTMVSHITTSPNCSCEVVPSEDGFVHLVGVACA